jgi:hypothetical protein
LLENRRKLLFAQLGAVSGMNERAFIAAFGLVAALDGMSRIAEGARHAEAALALAPPGADTWRSYSRALGLYGWELVQLGRLDEGIAKLMRALALEKAPAMQSNIRASLSWVYFVTGACSLPEAAVFAQKSPHALQQLLTMSPWSMRVEEVQQVLKMFNAVRPEAGRSKNEHVAEIHLAALQGKKAHALRELKNAEAAGDAAGQHQGALRFVLKVLRTQVHLLLGQKNEARAALKQAEHERHAVPDNITIEYNWRRIHWRNAMKLADARTPAGKKLLQEAKDFAHWAQNRGFETHA